MLTGKQGKPKEQKKTRGYRLKPSTHEVISKIQKLMMCDQDKAISEACNKFYNEIKLTKIDNTVKAA